MNGKKGGNPDTRTVQVGTENSKSFPNNSVVTSKYTLWNFIPKNLCEQFRRIANFYFLCVGLISLLVDSPIGPATTLLPLAFVILVTAIKQGYEDYLRHRSDREINSAAVWVLRNKCLEKIPSKKIKVGDIVKVNENDDVPCDLVLLTSSLSNSKCYVTTSSLDGETNLKTMYCPKSLKYNIKSDSLTLLHATIECENPIADLYKFNGRMEFSRTTSLMLKKRTIDRQTSLLQTNPTTEEALANRCSDQPAPPKTFFGGPNGEEGFRDVFAVNPSQNHLSLFRNCPTEPNKNLTFPKRAMPKHKKSYSNVTNVSWDPDFFENFEKAKLSFRRKDRDLEKLVDALTAENLLLKGSTLKNTEYVYGCAVYTGQETKMALNTRLTQNKFSMIDKSINKFLLFQLGILLVETISCTIMNSTIDIKSGKNRFDAIYVDEEEEEPPKTFASVLKDFVLFLMAYNYLLPISLYVTLEMTKFLGSLLFKWDLGMYDEGSGQAALSNTSDLNEELGEVEYLFTDKTGTLTENNLRFHSCSVQGVPYTERDGALWRIEEDESLSQISLSMDFANCTSDMQLFLLALTLCNTVQVIYESEVGSLHYSATSPDEKAFVEAMKRLGIVFADDDDFVVVNAGGSNRIYQKLEVLEFSSSRKLMSVIVKDQEGKIRLYCKGAESAVLPKVVKGPVEATLEHVSTFAKKGLRTLVVGYRDLTEEEYGVIERQVLKARETLSANREEVLRKTYQQIEHSLTLLGATGVEDQLQEGVKETLRSLRIAGIKTWMLTGDKVETAVQISIACGHFCTGMKQLHLTQILTKEECEEVLRKLTRTVTEESAREYGLVVDGSSLHLAIQNWSAMFRDLCMRCTAVVCCRLSPLQKSEVVRLMKNQKKPPIVAAIGDGANDASMIKEAHVGLGIMGKEGRQAVLSSDYAFAKFRFLERTLLVHGHWYYMRTANLVQYFFYKNIVFIMPQFYYFFFAGYSVQQLYESLFYVCYNTLFTSLPVLIYGVYEQNYPASTLLRYPQLYKIHRRNILLSWNYFLVWLFLGVWHSLVVFFVPTGFDALNSTSIRYSSLETYGTIIYNNSVVVVNLKLLLHSRSWSSLLIGSVLVSVLGLSIVTAVYSSVYMLGINEGYYWTFNLLIRSPNYWLLSFITWVTALIPDVLVYVYLNQGSGLSEEEMRYRKFNKISDETAF